MKKIYFAALILLGYITSTAQIITTRNNDGNQLAQMLVGSNVFVNNVTLNCADGASGTFTCSNCSLGMPMGIALTTGDIKLLEGPNNSSSTTRMNGYAGDTTLNNLLFWFDSTTDACALELDVLIGGDSIEFKYAFGSEEYQEWVNAGFNDVFGCYISGPGINGMENIALVPGTQIPASIDSINNVSNSQYYVDNGDGFSEPYNNDSFYIQYDGFTTVLTSKRGNLQSFQTYHLKLVVADVNDELYDSGIFLYANSLTAYGSDTTNFPPIAIQNNYSIYKDSIGYIHATLNDVDLNGDSLCVTAVWGSQHANTAEGDSCEWIQYDATNVPAGIDTVYYSICDNGTPILCDTAVVVIYIEPNRTAPIAVNDNYLVPVPNDTLLRVTNNDTIGDNSIGYCITEILDGASNNFSIIGCNRIRFGGDSTLTDTLTIDYVICDIDVHTLCDTASLTIIPVHLPQAHFEVLFENLNCYSLTTVNTSLYETDSVKWLFTSQWSGQDTAVIYGDTAYYLNMNMYGYYGTVCIYVSNEYGADTMCKQLSYICEGINEIGLSGIKLYPIPTSSMLSIDMLANTDEITQNYSGIEVYDVLGKRVIWHKGNHTKIANIDVSNLGMGIYTAILLGKSSERRSLGRFIKE